MKAFQIGAVLMGGIAAGLNGMAKAQEPNPVPQKFKAIYPAPRRAESDVQQAIALAAKQQKRVLLDFGD